MRRWRPGRAPGAAGDAASWAILYREHRLGVLGRSRGNTCDRHRLGIALGLDHVRRRVPAGHLALHLDRPAHGILIVTGGHSPPQPLGGDLHERVAAGAGVAGEQCRVGVGGPQAALADVHASYTEARRAARTAQHTRVIGQVLRHDRPGVYRLPAGLPADLLRHRLPTGPDGPKPSRLR
ncbi:hypothetical protein [Streptomyces sp. NPDC046182]|uniref:hypothetical protein n=1 Tax=Streptomyces sp. NPDC046182 TaxID=3154601 RepID=UPI00340C2111